MNVYYFESKNYDLATDTIFFDKMAIKSENEENAFIMASRIAHASLDIRQRVMGIELVKTI